MPVLAPCATASKPTTPNEVGALKSYRSSAHAYPLDVPKSTILRTGLALLFEAESVCGHAARTDLCRVPGNYVPTATIKIVYSSGRALWREHCNDWGLPTNGIRTAR